MASAPLSTVSTHSSALRRARIVDAAARLFAATRYDAVQIDDVARAAGVAKPTLYRYFATKEELFLEAFDTLLGEVAAEMADISDRGDEAKQTVAEMVRILLEKLGGNNSGARLFDGSGKRFGLHTRMRLQARTRQIQDSLAAAVKRGIDIGEFRDIDPDFVALAIIGSLRMIATKIPSRRRAAAARTIAGILIEGISAGNAPIDSAPSLQAAAQIDALGVD
jgi:AcrR family transcriptional regulator